ncbi:tetratricopeptide repeat protein [Blastococcus mobilis]|uniref:Tetratricopeptide repeat-containing protein n=1 Tax=Blastococcus mobilis TaxID=1938746 RepID=A0A238ZFJ2_9ACTN|nr:tetratricopeptide repeat protein [Blastococcus mobilis]SNR81751.1 Tetratricopeptide repeat-containing protein [Blastococcus mobilis]
MVAEQESLEARLGRYPVGRYPVQHATAQFHLGAARLAAGEPTVAVEALTVARQVFGRVGLRLEEAKATNMLGIALRESGRPGDAETAFRAAVGGFAALGQPVERAAASYNLGLVLRDAGDLAGAQTAWEDAQRSFLTAGQHAEAGACAREHGASLLTAGDPTGARLLLEEAVELAERGGDLAGLGAALNGLGLALLATDRSAEAAEAFRRALGGFPRAVRPAEYAMAKANLALAAARAGQDSRARLAARQALAVAAATGPVRDQARQVLAVLPPPPGDDLLTVLDSEPPDRWTATLREEVLRLVEATASDREAAVAGLLEGALARPGAAVALGQSLLHVLLELPPAAYDAMVRAAVAAGVGSTGRSTEAGDALAGVMRSAMARFPLPQWQRLATSFDAVAAERGERLGWR